MTVTEVTSAGGDTALRRTPPQVQTRDGGSERADVRMLVATVERWADDLPDVDPLRVATRTISGLYDGATTAELDRLTIQTAAEMIGTEPRYSPRRPAAGQPHRAGGTPAGRHLVQRGDPGRPRRGPDR